MKGRKRRNEVGREGARGENGGTKWRERRYGGEGEEERERKREMTREN